MEKEILNKLDIFNDPNFRFNPEKHKYTYKGEPFISVTQYISKFHTEFDSDYWSKYKAEQTGLTQEQILESWQDLNDRANHIGHSTHDWIENYFNRVYQELPNDIDIIKRINKFNVIFAEHLHKLTPIKFEQMIFSKKWKIAGMIDALFVYKDKLLILDYKTNKKFTTSNKYGEKLLEPFEEFDKTHLTEYSIQISLYALILKEIGLDVHKGYLVYIGPGDEPAKIYKCVDMKDQLEKYLNDNLTPSV